MPATSATHGRRSSASTATPPQRTLERAGVDVRLSWRAQRIEPDAYSGFAVIGAGDRLESDAVVLAVPHERAIGLPARGRAA